MRLCDNYKPNGDLRDYRINAKPVPVGKRVKPIIVIPAWLTEALDQHDEIPDAVAAYGE